MTKEQRKELLAYHLEKSKTENLYHLVFGEWPENECDPILLDLLWMIVLAVPGGNMVVEYLNEAEISKTILIYSENEVEHLIYALKRIKKNFGDIISQLWNGKADFETVMGCISTLVKQISQGIPCDDDVLSWTIDKCEFSVRTYNCLTRANIKTVGQLVEKSEAELCGIRNMLRKNMDEIHTFLKVHDLDAPLSET